MSGIPSQSCPCKLPLWSREGGGTGEGLLKLSVDQVANVSRPPCKVLVAAENMDRCKARDRCQHGLSVYGLDGSLTAVSDLSVTACFSSGKKYATHLFRPKRVCGLLRFRSDDTNAGTQ